MLFLVLLRVKTFNYVIGLWPIGALWLAWLAGRWWDRGGRWSRTSAVVLAVLLIGEGGRAVVSALERARLTTPYDWYAAQVARCIPPGSRVLGFQHYWLGLRQFEYRAWLLAFNLADSAPYRPPASIEAALERVDPTIVLIDRHARALFQRDVGFEPPVPPSGCRVRGVPVAPSPRAALCGARSDLRGDGDSTASGGKLPPVRNVRTHAAGGAMTTTVRCPGSHSFVRLPLVPLALVLAAVSLTAAAVPAGRPEDVGLSAERLERINQVVQRAIEAREISGAVTLVSRRGRIAHFEAQGMMDVEHKTPMRKDAIFRIASMTKPVTGVAILMLVEEGKVRLSDPVSRFIPEFKDTKVAIRARHPAAAGWCRSGAAAPEIYTVPASRSITVRDLLTHTSGLASGGAGAREASRAAPGRTTDNLAAHVAKLGAAPLDFQPGTRWAYSALAGIDTLGRIVEVASGLTFDEFLRRRLFEPLGMKDTSFVPAPASLPRVGHAVPGEFPPGWSARRLPAGWRPPRCSPAAAASGLPRRITSSSARCSSTAGNWAACGSSARGPST